MASRGGEMINLVLQRSFTPNCKKSKNTAIDDYIVTSARRVLSTKINYVQCPQYSTVEFLKSLKSKYTLLKSTRPKKKKKKKKLNGIQNNSQSPMKNTELNGQNLSLPTPKVVLFSPENVHLGWKGQVPVGSGFINLGTTCYINSTLQALFHVPSFVNWLMDEQKHLAACERMNGMHHSECIVCSMFKTMRLSHQHSGGNLRPRHIIEKVKSICKHLSPCRQEDAHEFLRYLMEAMEKSYTATLGIQAKKLDNFSKETTPLNQIFGGYIRTEVTCLECCYVSTTFQHFQDLILDIRQPNTTTVYDALESYFSNERLDGDEAYHCERCKKKVPANKKFSIERTPNALCIQLKRFNVNSLYGGSKLSKPISLQQVIDLSKYKHKNGLSSNTMMKYRLVSMVFHHGSSVNSGHYTALGCTSSGSYYYFNDEHVYPVTLSNYTNNPNAYIMFYELEKSTTTGNVNGVVKSVSSNSLISLTNGCMNGSVQPRTNGFMTKRENFLTTNHSNYRHPSWESVEKKMPTVKSVPNSLVPYTQSSDSEDNDDENKLPVGTENKSTENMSNDSSSSTLSPLAKKNSTLTGLLSSAPSNDNFTNHVSPTPRPLSNFKSTLQNGIREKENATEVNGENTMGKRNPISFSLNSEKKKEVEKNGVSQPSEVKEAFRQTTMHSYLTNGTLKKDAEEKRSNGIGDIREKSKNFNESNQANRCSPENSSEGGKVNGFYSGVNKTLVNGSNRWTITNMKDTENSSEIEKYQSRSSNGDWTVTEKENGRLNSSPKKESNCNDHRKFNGNSNDVKNENHSQKELQNGTNHDSYSSQNGYGAKVFTWNGELSFINKESEQDRNENNKRSYNYDDEIDRGKVKKMRFPNRENHLNSQSPKKNYFQQHQNHLNNRKWGFTQNKHNYNYHNQRFGHNVYVKNNNSYYQNRNGNYHYQKWRR